MFGEGITLLVNIWYMIARDFCHQRGVTNVLRDQQKRRLLKMTPQIPTMTMIYRRNRESEERD